MKRNGSLLSDNIAFRTDSARFLERIARERGDVARFKLDAGNAVLFTHPDAVRAVLVEHAASFRKGKLVQRARRLLGDGLLTSEGDAHRMQRRKIQPAFSTQQIARYASQIPTVTRLHAQHYTDAGRFSLNADMDALAMRIVATTLFGADIIERAPAVTSALQTLARWAPFIVMPGSSMLERCTPVPNARRVLEETIAELINVSSTDSPLLHALTHGQDSTTSSTRQRVRDEVMTIFIAGHDTTAAALTWTWIMLGEHPDVREELEREVCDVDDARESPYLDAVIQEVLRLYPPIARIGRRPVHDIEVCGETVSAGDAVFVSPYVTQRDARWFEHPDQFLPERWLHAPSIPRFAFFPFGAGPRSCIGEHFARRSIAAAIATLVREWRITPVRAGVPRARALLTLKPRGTVEARSCPRD